VSCTREVGSHPISTRLRTYHLEDLNGHEIKNVKPDELITYTDEDAVLVAGKPEEGGKVFNFELIDTPGLDDSEGNDMEIMAGIIGMIGHVSHLNAVIYVRSLDKPFGNSFNRFYDYIARCMPMLSNGLIVVHTRYTVDRVDEAMAAGKNLAEGRKEAFKKATKGRVSLAHFFMDNSPDDYSPFARMQSFNECRRLLNLLSTQRGLDVSKVKLLKAPNMANVDAHILFALGKLHTNLKRQLDQELAAKSKSKNQIIRLKREIARLKAKLEENNSQLEQYDSPAEIVLGTKTVAEDYNLGTFFMEGALWLDKRDVSFDADCIISRVQKSVGKGCRWLDEDRRGTTWRAKLKSSIFRSMEGTATFYTTSQLKYKGETEHLRNKIKDAAETIEFHEDQLRDLGDTDERDAETERLGEHTDRCARTIETIQRDTFDATLWPLLRPFYTSRSSPRMTEIIDFVSVCDPETAKLMSL
jgi:hypothetical protein